MNKFAFLIHALDLSDVIRFEPKAANKRPELVHKIMEWTPPYLATHITGIKSLTGKEIEGYFIAVPFLPYHFFELPEEQVMGKILKAGQMAEELGAQILGLGGYTAVVGNAGYKIAKQLSISVTSGNSYTVATALEGVTLMARELEIDLAKVKVAVIGATGSIGRVSAHILAKQVPAITLVARNSSRLKNLALELKETCEAEISYTTNIAEGLKNARVIISATSSPGEIIHPDMIAPGCLICDVALPHDVGRDVATKREDVLVIEGGIVEVPGSPNFNYDFGYPPKHALACMAETMILTLEERFETYTVGRKIKIGKVEEISRLAQKHGFKLAGLRSFDRPVTKAMIEKVKKASRKIFAAS